MLKYAFIVKKYPLFVNASADSELSEFKPTCFILVPEKSEITRRDTRQNLLEHLASRRKKNNERKFNSKMQIAGAAAMKARKRNSYLRVTSHDVTHVYTPVLHIISRANRTDIFRSTVWRVI